MKKVMLITTLSLLVLFAEPCNFRVNKAAPPDISMLPPGNKLRPSPFFSFI